MSAGAPVVLALGLSMLSATAGAGEIRVITGPGITPPPRSDTPPQRIEPPRPPPKPPAPIVARRLPWIVVDDAATLRSGRIVVHPPGVEPAPLDRVCVDDEGARWACGMRARAAIAALVRLNRVACPLPRDAREGTFEVACTLGTADYAARIVRAGLATATPGDAALAAAEAEAREQRRGLWGAAPKEIATRPGFEATGTPDGLPPDRTTAPLSGAGPEETGPTGERRSTAPLPLGR